ncbi:MAG: gamma-glutamyltransferase, partial [Acidobacteriaceae bacterium]
MNKSFLRFTAFALPLCLIAALTRSLPAQTSPSAGVDPDTATLLTNDQPVRAEHAMVVTVHHLATDAGVEILKEGGNAVDSAVGVGFALAVVYPFAGNLGGGGFMLIHEHSPFVHGHHGDRDLFIDYREKAPLAASANMYLDASGNVIPKSSIVGYRAIGVPGSVAGLVYAERNYGRLTLEKVMAPAIRLASDGFVLTDQEAAELHDPLLTQFPASREIFQRDGDFYKSGDTFKQPELAETLRRIAANPEDFYQGAMARQIAEAIQQGGGLITANDLAQYTAKVRKPVTGSYHGYTIV